MNKLPKIKHRSISNENMFAAYLPSSRHRSKRVIFNDKMIQDKENFNYKQLVRPSRERPMPLHSIKNLQFFGCKNTKVLIGNPLYEKDKSNKSFDDAAKLIDRRKKIRRARTAIRLRNAYKDNLLISEGTSKVYKTYGMKMFKNLLDNEKKHHVSNPLHNHNVSNDFRSRMVDWMVEVISIFGKSQETYFLSVYILDNFLSKSNKIYENGDVHLLGLACMLVSSKYTDIYPLDIVDIVEKIGHNAFGPKKIQKREVDFLK